MDTLPKVRITCNYVAQASGIRFTSTHEGDYTLEELADFRNNNFKKIDEFQQDVRNKLMTKVRRHCCSSNEFPCGPCNTRTNSLLENIEITLSRPRYRIDTNQLMDIVLTMYEHLLYAPGSGLYYQAAQSEFETLSKSMPK